MTKTLDLGCGEKPRNPYNAKELYGIDLNGTGLGNIRQADLALHNIPFPSGFFNYVTAYDFLEHIPRYIYIPDFLGLPKLKYPFVQLMNEIYRVLKDDGIFYSSTPCIPYGAAFQDPTHVNYITPDTFGEYFDDKKTWAKHYGFKGAFKIVSMEIQPPHLVAVLQKVKLSEPHPEAA